MTAGKNITAVIIPICAWSILVLRPRTSRATTATWSMTRCWQPISSFKIQPQVAECKVSDDKLTYTFTMREGLKSDRYSVSESCTRVTSLGGTTHR